MTSLSRVEGGAMVRELKSVDRAACCAIAVMAKASIPGVTKTRLVPPLSAEQAAELNSAFLSDIAENLALAGREASIAPYMAFGPPGSAAFFENRFPGDIGLIEIWFADFGECLFQTIERLLAIGYGSVCVLNSDSPTLPTARLVEAAHALAVPGDRVVLGPSTDGGYYLLGVKAPHRRLFEDIAWSTEVVASQTSERAAELGLDLVTLAPWYDVDDEETLRRLAVEVSASSTVLADAGPSHTAPHTAPRLAPHLAPHLAPDAARHAARHTAAAVGRLLSACPALLSSAAGLGAASASSARAADFA